VGGADVMKAAAQEAVETCAPPRKAPPHGCARWGGGSSERMAATADLISACRKAASFTYPTARDLLLVLF
jgi:hypothetical protein